LTAPLQTLPSEVDASIDPTEGQARGGGSTSSTACCVCMQFAAPFYGCLCRVLLVVTTGTIHILTGIESGSGFLCKTEAVYEDDQ